MYFFLFKQNFEKSKFDKFYFNFSTKIEDSFCGEKDVI